MKGGITSGIVYPLAITKLSERYRLRNVGGTSAGAIAAAAAAAAERGRREGIGSGFPGLAELPGELQEDLSSLFQPKWSMVPFFKVMLAAGKPKPGRLRGLRRLARGIAAALLWFGLVPLLALAPPAFVVLSHDSSDGGLLAGLAVGLVAFFAFAGAAVALCVIGGWWFARALGGNYLGMCSGYRRDEGAPDPPLTTWLTSRLDELAGIPEESAPLTFGDLWGQDIAEDPSKEKDINLEVITTSLTHGAPFRLPGLWEDNSFWFSEEEFRDLFPRRVVDHMVETARPSGAAESKAGLHHFPEPKDIPVVVAARMSLSFPVLISAMPIWAKNYSRKVDSDDELVTDENRRPEHCWLSDGGIISNFPIHFFDSPVPRWPTFGISLQKFGHDWHEPPTEVGKVHVPVHNSWGLQRVWTPWDRKRGLGLVGAFLGSILGASRSWLDNAQARSPGFRDRIASIGHNKDEGGMNLEMDEETIAKMSERGRKAAEELIDHFAVPPTTAAKTTWENQRWVRHRSFLGALEGLMTSYKLGIDDHHPGDPPLFELIERSNADLPSYEFKDPAAGKRVLTRDVTRSLFELSTDWTNSAVSLSDDDAPAPLPDVSARPRP